MSLIGNVGRCLHCHCYRLSSSLESEADFVIRECLEVAIGSHQRFVQMYPSLIVPCSDSCGTAGFCLQAVHCYCLNWLFDFPSSGKRVLQGHPERSESTDPVSQILQYPPLTLSRLSSREGSGLTCQRILCRYLWSSLSGSTSLPWWHLQVSRTWSVPGADYSFSTFALLLDFWASFYQIDCQ